MSLPVLNLIRGWPTDARELARFFNDLNLSIRKHRTRVFASNHRFLNRISTANKHSSQSVQPLTSNDLGGGLADIQIAAHNIQDGDGVIAYSSGSITGLANSTKYYVYADDPDSDGGSVTYLSTTNPLNLTAGKDRYYLGTITTDAPAGGGTSGGYGGGGGGGGEPIR